MRAGAALLVLACVASVAAQRGAPRDIPPSEDRLLNAAVPDIELNTTTGARITLSQVADGRPLVLAFVFTRCGGVCSPFLTSWRSADRAVGRKSKYSRLVLSFDPRDTTSDMSAFAHHHALDDTDDWTFAVAEPQDVRRLAEAMGFWWDGDEGRQPLDHPAMLAGIRNGRLVRLLVGGSITSVRLDEFTRELSGEFVRSYPLPGRMPFRCLKYDAATGRTTLDWGFALLLVPMAATGAGTFVLFAAGARSRRKQT